MCYLTVSNFVLITGNMSNNGPKNKSRFDKICLPLTLLQKFVEIFVQSLYVTWKSLVLN